MKILYRDVWGSLFVFVTGKESWQRGAGRVNKKRATLINKSNPF